VTRTSDAVAVADTLHSTAIHLLRGLRKVDEETGLSAARLSALSVVVFGGPVTLGQLASAEQVSPPTMTRLVGAMESDGLVRRNTDLQDRRVTWITATARGKRILQEGRARRIAMLAGALKNVSAEELRLLDDAGALLTRIIKAMSHGA
jgi:DNA-binding MarR family transcriptional regulator